MRPHVGLFLLLTACGGGEAANAGAQCAGDAPKPSISPSDALGANTAGGADAWVEIASSHVEPVAANNHVLLDGKEVPVVRVTSRDADEPAAIDATGGQLTPRQEKQRTGKREGVGPAHTVAFRVPAGTAPGQHVITLRTCSATSDETVPFEVLPTPAPQLSSIKVVRGEYPTLYLKGTHLLGVDEVLLVSDDGVTRITTLTRVDDTELHVALDKAGTYEVFVRSKTGLAGGPPNGNVIVR